MYTRTVSNLRKFKVNPLTESYIIWYDRIRIREHKKQQENTKMYTTCEICGATIDLASDGWLEGDTGDICSDCVGGAKGHEEA